MGGKIVVGIDGSKSAEAALHWALGEARLRGARLEVLYGWHIPYLAAMPTAPPVIDRGELQREAEHLLADTLASADTNDVEVVAKAVASPGAMALIERSGDADLVVVGSRGRGGFAGLLLGSVSQQVVAHAHCPVVVVRGVE